MRTEFPGPNLSSGCIECHASFNFHMKNPGGVKYVTMRPFNPEFIMEDSGMPILEDPIFDVHLCTSFKQELM